MTRPAAIYHDATLDPTRTTTLRRAFRAAASLQLGQLRAALRRAVIDGNVLGLDGGAGAPFLGPDDRLRQFSGWFEQAAFVTLDAQQWVDRWLHKAIASGARTAEAELRGDTVRVMDPAVVAHLRALGEVELKGIRSALTQKVGREAHSAIVKRARPAAAFRALGGKPFDDAALRLKAFCLPGDTLVSAPDAIAFSKRRYEGDLVVIRTAAGHELSCTPNHPILTGHGEVAAQHLNAGDEIVCDCNIKWERRRVVNDNDMPSSIEEVSRLLVESRQTDVEVISLSRIDFHGDATDGDVAVIGADSFLRRQLYAAHAQQLREQLVGFSNLGECLLACRGMFGLGRERLFDVASAFALALRPLFPLGLAELSPVTLECFAYACAAADVAAPIERARFGDTAYRDATAHQQPPHGDLAHLMLSSERVDGRASGIGIDDGSYLDRIVSKQARAFVGHVFNLQTESGYYIANGVKVHNCNVMTVKAHVAAKLETYRANGLSHVGVVAERHGSARIGTHDTGWTEEARAAALEARRAKASSLVNTPAAQSAIAQAIAQVAGAFHSETAQHALGVAASTALVHTLVRAGLGISAGLGPAAAIGAGVYGIDYLLRKYGIPKKLGHAIMRAATRALAALRPAQTADAVLDTTLRMLADALDAYNPDQPRVPAGSPEGGQWIGFGGFTSYTPKPGAWRRPAPRSQGDPRAPSSTLVVRKESPLKIGALNGIAFTRWKPPKDWNNVSGQRDLGETPLSETQPLARKIASGLIIRESDGRVWVVRPRGGWGGYEHTFPKGRVEPGLSLQANAIKEAWEESGIKARIVALAGDRKGDLTLTRYYLAERESGDPSYHDKETSAVALVPVEQLEDFLNKPRDLELAEQLGGTRYMASGQALDMTQLTKVSGKMGSNPGGVYQDASGNRFYIKQGKSEAHVANELAAARLYALTGAPTLTYRAVKGGGWIATEMQKLDKSNAAQFDAHERMLAQRDFAAHAWLANWDAVGLEHDNLGMIGGKPVELDVGGALAFRAQGQPKGKAFGESVGELDTLRDSKINPQAASIFGDMTKAQIVESAQRVISIPDQAIRDAAANEQLADKLLARRDDIATRLGLAKAQAVSPVEPAPGDDLDALWLKSKQSAQALDTYAAALKPRCDAIAKQMFVDPDLIGVSTANSTTLQGTTLASTDDNTGQVTMFARVCTPKAFGGTLAHELTHVKYKQYRNAYKAEKAAFEALPDDQKQAALDRNAFPIYQGFEAHYDLKALQQEDGVSDYSKWWWGKTKGGHWLSSAVYETLAEMARVKLETGELPGGPHHQALYYEMRSFWMTRKPKGYHDADVERIAVPLTDDFQVVEPEDATMFKIVYEDERAPLFVVGPKMLRDVGWTEEARAAALEARRAKAGRQPSRSIMVTQSQLEGVSLDEPYEVLVNPSRNDVLGLLGEARDKWGSQQMRVRAMLDHSGNLYVWQARQAIHRDAALVLGIEPKDIDEWTLVGGKLRATWGGGDPGGPKVMRERIRAWIGDRGEPPSMTGREAPVEAYEPSAGGDEEDNIVGVRTAEDDLVCNECEAFAETSPVTIDEALATLPIHPSCRCSVYPYWDLRFKHD